MTKFDFSGRKVFISGGSRGIGRACAQLFANAGARVAITYHSNIAAATTTLNSLSGEGHHAYQLDMAEHEKVQQTVHDAFRDLGGLDILINNAGVFTPHPIDKLAFTEWFALWQNSIDVNLSGAAAACHAAVQHFIKQGKGRIVNVGSRGAFRGEGGQPGYGAAKAGLHAMSQSLAQALGGYGITVHAVAPGFVETAMARPHLQGEAGEAVKRQSPLNRVATVQDIAQAIAFLASPASEFTTGCILDINGASYLRT